MTVKTEPADPNTDTRTAWHCVHVYYYDPDKDDLILDAVRPLFAELRPLVKGLHLAPHWRRGPHLRLFAKTDRRTWTDVVLPRVEAVIGDYLARHPSTADLDVERHLAQHRLLAAREREHGPLVPWFPDNTIHEQPCDDRSHVIRSPRTAELMAEFASDSAPLLFAMLDRVRAGTDDKELVALELMLATTVTACGSITRGFASYRSHAEGFLYSCNDPEAVRARFDAHYESRRDALLDRTRSVLAALDGTGHATPFARHWAALCRQYGHRVDPLVAEGLVFPPLPADAPAVKPRAPMHAMMFGNRAYRETVFRHPNFLRYRFLLNCAYLQVNRLGLTPVQRFRTCHAAANAVEELHGVSAVDRIRAFVESHPDDAR
ncbi:thiopeptide maturation pyridine synthase [Actinosynnema sp. NPDC004786]